MAFHGFSLRNASRKAFLEASKSSSIPPRLPLTRQITLEASGFASNSFGMKAPTGLKELWHLFLVHDMPNLSHGTPPPPRPAASCYQNLAQKASLSPCALPRLPPVRSKTMQ